MRAKETIQLVVTKAGMSIERCFNVQAKRVRVEATLLCVKMALLWCVSCGGLG